MLNKVILNGRLGRDPEMRVTPAGVPVTSVTLAVDRDFGKDGNKETDWIDVVAWRETAKFLADHFTKGRMIIVSGRLQIRSWTDNDGNKRKTAEVVADNVYFGDSKKEESSNTGFVKSESVPASNFAVLDEPDFGLPF